jgi:hypothetical protein
MHSNELKRMKDLVTPSFSASYHVWEQEFNKSIRVEEMQTILDFHASKTIHRWHLFLNTSIILSSIVQFEFEIIFDKMCRF